MLIRDYFCFIKLSDTTDSVGVDSFLSTNDKEYLSRFKSVQRQNTTIIMRNLARQLLQEKSGIPDRDWEFSIQQNGNRIATTLNGDIFHISFSHSPNWGAVVIGEHPVGIDIEELKPGRPWQDMQEFLNRPEGSKAIETEKEFLQEWTAYEAHFKQLKTQETDTKYHYYYPSPQTVLCIASCSKNSHAPEKIPF